MSTQDTPYDTCHPVAQSKSFGGTLGNILKKNWRDFATHMQLRQQRRIDRQAFRYMLTLENRILKDIGIDREDVNWANRLPLDRIASRELEKVARQNKTVI
ncbi:MAG: hypothetical protein V3V04_04735 [Rhizobiaceae bacterium]